MNKGTRFYKCDFQVHSPRDINWNGERAITDDERKSYAEAFVKKCRELGLNAVAITDHHDFAFYPYIKNAASSELTDDGDAVPKENQLVVFPGLELTFSTPASCQGILILDAEFPQELFGLVLSTIGVVPKPSNEATTEETTAIPTAIISSLSDFYKKFDAIDSLKGKYILLPNVSDGGHGSILRRGFYEHYIKMPCVGGYVDGNISQREGHQNIINGKDRNYGFKSISVIQTSDNRHNDFSKLGQNVSWIKWAEPTSEALRQAFLAKESRLAQSLPEIPQIYITKIDVTNSKFLGSFSLEFNQQYNAFIGGRGTGKSSILEYLRWGLCDLGEQDTISLNQSEVDRRRQSLIEKTLIPFNGDVRVTFSLNGIQHVIKRNSISKETLLKIGDGDFEAVREEEIRRILPIQAYSQKQLSSVGVRTDELKRFIQLPIANQLSNLKFKASDIAKEINSTYNDFVRKREVQNEIDQFNLEIKSLNDQVESLRKTLSGITEEHQAIISKKQKYLLESSLINKSQQEFITVRNSIDELSNSLNNYPERNAITEQFENKELFVNIEEERVKEFDNLKDIVSQLKAAVSPEKQTVYISLINTWNELNNKFNSDYEAAKATTSSNQMQLQEISRIEQRLQELADSLNERNAVLKELGNPEVEFESLRTEWFNLHQSKVDLLNVQAEEFAVLSKGLIKAEITKSIDVIKIKNQITRALQGTRIQEVKIQSLCDHILDSGNPLESYKEIINELKLLAEQKTSEDKKVEIPETGLLTECGFNDGNKTRIIQILTPNHWLDIATTEIEFNPEFKYTTNKEMGDQILFSEASAGQQATALLTVLLNQPGAPLLIDQPEDDIDNRAIEEIINNIWDAKKKRQLIFTSHNANLVVNGDAELVVCCDYKESGSQTRGAIVTEGSIDSPEVKDQITSVMEGGEKAFRLRKEKYGF